MTEKEIQELALKYFRDECTYEEELLLHKWYENVNEAEVVTVREDFDAMQSRLYSQIQGQITNSNSSVRPIKYNNKKWLYYAASIVMFLSFSMAFYYFSERTDSNLHAVGLLKNDVEPGGNSAVLELADGTKINLDEVVVGGFSKTNGLIISKIEDGILELEVEKSSRENVNEVNVIHTPRGGQYRVKLPDGTVVFLNSSSTLKFPSIFNDDFREVELEGEAFFEVVKFQNKRNKEILFFVKSKGQRIEVLGTSFNVSSYSNENVVKTTLLEGAVRILVDQSKESFLLKPGQQGKMLNGEMLIGPADLDSEIAWKNGDFIFNNEPLSSIMKKIERWYDIEVVYQNKIESRKFSGAVSRSKKLSSVLGIMELTGKVGFKIEGRRVIAMD